MKLYPLSLLLALCAVSIIGCSDTPTGDPATFWYRYNTAIRLEAGRTTYMLGSGPTTRDRAVAVFNTPDSLGANAGVVSFEGVALPTQDSIFPTQTGSYFIGRIYSLYSAVTPLPLKPGGRLNTFTATGGPTVPPMTISAPSPVRDIAVTAPLDDDSLSKDAGFIIRWENSTQEGTLIELRVYPLAAGAPLELEIHEPVVADNGSYAVAPSLLAEFPNGPIGISVRRFLRTTGALADDHRYDARVYTQRIVYADLH